MLKVSESGDRLTCSVVTLLSENEMDRKHQYSIKFYCKSGHVYTPWEWRVRARFSIPGFGKPNIENLKKWIFAFEKSTVDGPNKHLGEDKVVNANIYDAQGKIVVEWHL